ncbi:hypothetical protein LINGRAHAP2_LOCUS11231 [Linum grandiflorum]
MCVCQYCHAIMWREESIIATQNRKYHELNMCCNGGEIRLPPALEPPTYLSELVISKHFREYIRAYNGIFRFTSLAGKVNRELNDGWGPNFSSNRIFVPSRRDSSYVWPVIYL